jgi:competence ComEA-like helix-hairpin-helix protein
MRREYFMKKKNIKWIWFVVALFFCTMVAGGALAAEVLKGKSVNINKATAEELVKNVPLMTPELAKNIVKYRKDNGDFQQKEELLQVKGMDRTLLKKWNDFFILEGIGGKDCTC